MDEGRGSHRTRSKAAPDWTPEESLTLVNEISAVESEWGSNLPSFQKWQQIVENCHALDVSRNLNHCRRQWDALMTEYRRVKNGHGENGSLPIELFEAIELCVTARGRKKGADGAEAPPTVQPEACLAEEQVVMDTDPDSDPEAQDPVVHSFIETGSKKQRCRMKRKKRQVERLYPWGYFTNPEVKHDETSSVNENPGNTSKNTVESAPDTNLGMEEKTMATILWENALQINMILESKLVLDINYASSDQKHIEAVQTDFTRRQGDELINCLEKVSDTLNQLCDFVQQCN